MSKVRSIKIIAKETLMELITPGLQSLSVINDNQHVSGIKKVPEGFELTIEVKND